MNKKQLEKRWGKIHSLITGARKIVCSTHVDPDGDGLGSQIAIYHFLTSQGRECRIYNPSELPQMYQFLSKLAPFETYDRKFHAHWLEGADLAVIFDSGDYSRLMRLGDDLKEFGVPSLSIDHHPHPNPNGFSYALHDSSACATGHLLYEYLKYANKRLGRQDGMTKQMAEGLYVAIMTDTGSFRFSNTSAEVHEMASELIRFGIKPHEVYQQVYESTPVERLLLMAAALKTVKVTEDGKLAWFTVTLSMINELGARKEHLSGFTDTVRSIGGVEVAVMFHELAADRCRVNFRSKGRIRVDNLARRLGGGGHPFAAGVTVRLPLEQAVEHVVREVLREIEAQQTGEVAS